MLELIRVTSTQIPGDVQKEVLKALKREKEYHGEIRYGDH